MSGRIRSLKPDWLEDELLSDSSSDARVLSVALILLADDHGNGRGSEKYLGAQAFPGQPLKVVRDALSRLVEIRYCRVYQVDGQSYFSIRNWSKHQRVDKPGRAKVPGPPENIPETLANVPETLVDDGGEFAPRARPLPSHPERGAGENQPDRETVVPLNLVELADEHGIPEQFAKAYRAPIEAVRQEVRETLTYWSIGGGAGKRKKNWMAVVRTRLHERGKAGLLNLPVPTGAANTTEPELTCL